MAWKIYVKGQGNNPKHVRVYEDWTAMMSYKVDLLGKGKEVVIETI